MTGREDWFKTDKRKRKEDEDDKIRTNKRKRGGEEEEPEGRTVSVLFVPYTVGGELIRRLRHAEQEMTRQTGVKVKMVEKAGTKLVDMLHQSDPWQGGDCGREGCLLCRTKVENEGKDRQDCTQRSVVYETWCLNCEKTDTEEKEDTEGEDRGDKKEKRKVNVPLYKYIGESARSAYERGLEHMRDYTEMKLESHMMKLHHG